MVKTTWCFIIVFYILQKNSHVIRIVAEFKKHMNKISKNIKYIYLISNLEPSQQIIRLINQYNFDIFILNYKVFMFEIPNHIEVSKHEILSSNEVEKLIFDLSLIDILKLPKIKIDDPQCIWIGAKSKDIIKITRNTINGISLYYRVVLGKTKNSLTQIKSGVNLGQIYVTKGSFILKFCAKLVINKVN